MAIRTIEFLVSESGITPSAQQFGGIQGEHNATELLFSLDSGLREKILAEADDGSRIVYRFDAYDGSGGMVSGAPEPLGDGALSFSISEWQTRFGGNVSVYLVITEIMNDETEMELYSFPAVLRLKSRPDSSPVEDASRESLSALVEVSKSAAESAASSALSALESQLKTEQSKVALENGSEFVFLGGNAFGSVGVDLVIDDELSAVSDNTVKNKVITEALKNVLLAAHPIGSYYWSEQSTNPSELFGGRWEQVKDRFVLAAGDNYSVGEVGGEAIHTLTVEELPKHRHTVGGNNKSGEAPQHEVYFDASIINETTGSWYAFTSFTGGGQPHNNMPPYIVAYCFKRVE